MSAADDIEAVEIALSWVPVDRAREPKAALDRLAALLAATEADRNKWKAKAEGVQWGDLSASMTERDRAEAAEKERDQALADVETVGEDLDAALAREAALREALQRIKNQGISSSSASGFEAPALIASAALATSPEGER